MHDLKTFDKQIQDIQDKVKSNREAIATLQALIKALAEEESTLNNQLNSCCSDEEIDELFEYADQRLKEINKARSKAQLRVKASQSALDNAEQQLLKAIEDRRVALKGQYELKILTLLKKINELRKELAGLILEFDALVKEADLQCYTPKENKPFNHGGGSLNAITSLPFIAFDNVRKRLQYHISQDRWNYFLKQIDSDNWTL